MYDVGKNLLFAASGPPPPPGERPVPAKYVSAVGLFDGSAPGADESFGERAVCRLRHGQPDASVHRRSQLASIDQLNRVRLSCGARPPGRGPRWTSTTGTLQRAEERTPGSADSLPTPARRDAHDDGARGLDRGDERLAARPCEERRRLDADHALYRERRVGKQAAGVASALARIFVRPDEGEWHGGGRGEPGSQLERSPIVLGTPEWDEHSRSCREIDRRAGYQRNHRRRALEDFGQVIGERLRLDSWRSVHEDELDVVCSGEPHQIANCVASGERGNTRGDGDGLAPRIQRRRFVREPFHGRQKARDDHLAGVTARKRLGDGQERVDSGQRGGKDENRPCCGCLRDGALEVEGRILRQDRSLERAKRRRWLDAELLDQLVSCQAVDARAPRPVCPTDTARASAVPGSVHGVDVRRPVLQALR